MAAPGRSIAAAPGNADLPGNRQEEKMKRKRFFWGGILTLSFLMGCGVTPLTPSGQAIPSVLSTKSIHPQVASLPSDTMVNTAQPGSTTTLTPTSVSTLVPSISPTLVIPQCNGGNSPGHLPDTFKLPGSIVVNDGNQGKLLSDFPLTTSKLPITETQDIEFFGTSPDGKWLAYSPYTMFQTEPRIENMKVVLLSANGERIEHKIDIIHSFPEFGETMYPNGLPLYWFGEWINNNLLYIQVYYLDAPGITKTIRLHAVLDPFQGQWRNELLANYPLRYEKHFVGISPDLMRTVYIQSNPTEVVLWNIQQQTEIWSTLAFRHASEVFIKWSPDSAKVTYFKAGFDDEADSHLYVMDRDGKNVIAIADHSYPILDFQPVFVQWSLDSRYLAIVANGQQPDIVYVYDSIEGRFAHQCSINGIFNGLTRLQWSPDNKYIAVFSYGVDFDTPIYMIDFDNNQVYELNQKGKLSGWFSTDFLEP
ncbi:MAG: TolB family protein [Chloroflexota bacterium]